MTRPLDGTIGGLVGSFEVLRVECDRFGCYSVAQLVAQYGARYRLTDWLSERTRDCPQKSVQGVVRACHAVMLDLSRLR